VNKAERSECEELTCSLPGAALTDRNREDQRICAQAWFHAASVLGGRNRKSIVAEKLRGHFEHRALAARLRGRKMEEVALEDVVGATIPREWSPRKRQQRSSNAGGFTRNCKGQRANLRRAR